MLGEEFKIERNGVIEKNTSYMFSSTGLKVKHRKNCEWWDAFPQIIRELNEGSASIIRH